MAVFDFIKKLFGWADQRSLKRKADNDITIEKEFVTPKKHRCNYQKQHLPEAYIELDRDSDSDEVTVLDERAYHPKSLCNKINGASVCSNQQYALHPAQCHSSLGKSSSCINRKESKMGYFSSKPHGIPGSSTEWCPTLSKTFQQRERHQYVEMLQNFVSPRIHVIRDEHKEQRPLDPEVIDLEESESTDPPYKEESVCRRPSIAPCVQWQTSSKAKDKRVQSNRSNYLAHTSYSKVEIYKNDTDTKKPQTVPQVKSISMNTLKDSLAGKAVMRNDYIPEVDKKYNERIEQRYKEVEELRKMTSLLSMRNRRSREVALEEQLARSARLCEAVLEDEEEPEEPPLPELTDEMIREIKSALVPRPPDEVLVEGFGLRVTRKDMNTLADLNWLNDEVINFYMNLLIARGSGEKYPKVYAMNTFFYPKLLSGGHSSLKRWTRKIDIFSQDLVVVPVHLGIHWCMSIIDFRDKTIRYYDSMGSSNTKCLTALRQYLEEESLDKKKQKYDTSEWKLENVKDIPQQMNGSDCGVFSCVFAEHICANRKINFTQKDMPYFRNKMVYEILRSKLL